jgi:hypothetical protein
MVTATRQGGKITMTDLGGFKRFQATLDAELTPRHTVAQAVDHYLTQMRIPKNGLDFMAFSRGVRLDGNTVLGDLPEQDTEWTVMPEVAAG